MSIKLTPFQPTKTQQTVEIVKIAQSTASYGNQIHYWECSCSRMRLNIERNNIFVISIGFFFSFSRQICHIDTLKFHHISVIWFNTIKKAPFMRSMRVEMFSSLFCVPKTVRFGKKELILEKPHEREESTLEYFPPVVASSDVKE